MAQFAVMIYAPTPADWTQAPPDELAAHEAHGAQIEELGGKTVTAFAFDSATSAKSVRGKDGKDVTDGPFVAGDQVIGGFSVIEARDIDHALEIARKNPATWRGGVEVRPLLG